MPRTHRHRRRAEHRLGAGCGHPRCEDGSDREADDYRDHAEPGGFEREGRRHLSWGETNGFQQPDLAVLRAGASADQDRDNGEHHDEQHDRVRRQDEPCRGRILQRRRALILPGLDAGTVGRHGRRDLPSERGSGVGVGEPDRLRPAPTTGIRLDPLQGGSRRPGQTGVPAGVTRLAGDDRGAGNGQLDRTTGRGESQRRTDGEAECVGEASFEHDAVRGRLHTLDPDRRVDAGRGLQSGDLQPVRLAVQTDIREGDGFVVLGDSGQGRDGASIGLGGHVRQRVRAVGRGERLLPGIACGRTDLQGEDDGGCRGTREQNSQYAREQPRSDAGEGEFEQNRGHPPSPCSNGKATGRAACSSV